MTDGWDADTGEIDTLIEGAAVIAVSVIALVILALL